MNKFRHMTDAMLESYVRRVEWLLGRLLADAKEEQARRKGSRKRRARRAFRPGTC